MLFLRNSYGTPEFPDCGNLVGADWMGNLSLSEGASTEPSMNFRETNTDPSMHFRKANTDSSMHFRKANTEYSMCFVHCFFCCSKVASLQFPANGTCRKRPTL